MPALCSVVKPGFVSFVSTSQRPSSASRTNSKTRALSMSDRTPAQRAIDFLHLTQSLKTTPRTGWVNHGIGNPESIADHMYRMSLMAMVASKEMPELCQAKCVNLALIHDLAEALVGDITPNDPVTKEEKQKLESDAMAKIREVLGDSLGGDTIEQLWHEYEDGITPEAKLLKDLDKLEMIQQAGEYEHTTGKDLSDFFTSTAGKFQTKVGQAWEAEIVSRRPKRDAQ
jgi:putative hydrolase of HD superfamily